MPSAMLPRVTCYAGDLTDKVPIITMFQHCMVTEISLEVRETRRKVLIWVGFLDPHSIDLRSKPSDIVSYMCETQNDRMAT